MFRRGGPCVFPLYIYPASTVQQTIGLTTERKPNLSTEIVQQIADKLGLTYTNEKEATEDTFAPIDILDYIYAVLHSPPTGEIQGVPEDRLPENPLPKRPRNLLEAGKAGRRTTADTSDGKPRAEQTHYKIPCDWE